MKLTDSTLLSASPGRVWEALNDPAVLVRTIPGCLRLEQTEQDSYRVTVTAGVASIKGTYDGTVELSDLRPPDSLVLRARGAGAPGTVDATARVSLSVADDGRTRLDYDADAIVGGMIGGVGQRVLVGVAKKTAREFFAGVDGVLTGAAPVPEPAMEPRVAATQPAAVPGVEMPRVYESPRRPAPGFAPPEFVKGAVFGAAIALLGTLAGGAIGALARRRRP